MIEIPKNKAGHECPRMYKLPFAPLEAQMKARGMSLMDMMEALGSDLRQKINDYKKTDDYKTVIKNKTQKFIERDNLNYVNARRKAIKSTQIPLWDNTLRSTWRYREDGLNTYHADHWAIALGLHPVQIWPWWYDIPDEVFIQQDPTAMELRAQIRKQKQNAADRKNHRARYAEGKKRVYKASFKDPAEHAAAKQAIHERKAAAAFKVTSNGKGGYRYYTEKQWKEKLERGKIIDKRWREKKAAERLASQHTTD